MNKTITILLLTLFAFSASIFAQGFDFGGYFTPADTNKAKLYTTYYGNHGVAVDPDGKIWIQKNAKWVGDSLEINGKTTQVMALHVFDKNFEEASFSPITFITVDSDVDTLGYGLCKTGTGLEVAKDGNIIASFASTVFKLNYKTGEGMAKIVPFGSGSTNLTSPDAEGNFCVAKVASATPVKKYSADFTFLADVIDTVYGFARSFELSPDGETIYWTAFTNRYTLSYHRNDPVFGTYKDKVDTLFKSEEFSIQSSDWDPKTGYFWFCAGPSTDHSPADSLRRHMYFALNPATGELVDSLMYEGVVVGGDKTIQHYSMSFSVAGDTLWLSNFDSKSGLPNVQYWVRNYIGVEEEPNAPVVNGYTLSQNYPNPFNPATVIKFHVAKEGLVSLKVYNTLGQEVAELVNEFMTAGDQKVSFNASHLASGTYIYRLNVNGVSLSNKMILVK